MSVLGINGATVDFILEKIAQAKESSIIDLTLDPSDNRTPLVDIPGLANSPAFPAWLNAQIKQIVPTRVNLRAMGFETLPVDIAQLPEGCTLILSKNPLKEFDLLILLLQLRPKNVRVLVSPNNKFFRTVMGLPSELPGDGSEPAAGSLRQSFIQMEPVLVDEPTNSGSVARSDSRRSAAPSEYSVDMALAKHLPEVALHGSPAFESIRRALGVAGALSEAQQDPLRRPAAFLYVNDKIHMARNFLQAPGNEKFLEFHAVSLLTMRALFDTAFSSQPVPGRPEFAVRKPGLAVSIQAALGVAQSAQAIAGLAAGFVPLRIAAHATGLLSKGVEMYYTGLTESQFDVFNEKCVKLLSFDQVDSFAQAYALAMTLTFAQAIQNFELQVEKGILSKGADALKDWLSNWMRSFSADTFLASNKPRTGPSDIAASVGGGLALSASANPSGTSAPQSSSALPSSQPPQGATQKDKGKEKTTDDELTAVQKALVEFARKAATTLVEAWSEHPELTRRTLRGEVDLQLTLEHLIERFCLNNQPPESQNIVPYQPAFVLVQPSGQRELLESHETAFSSIMEVASLRGQVTKLTGDLGEQKKTLAELKSKNKNITSDIADIRKILANLKIAPTK